MPLPFRTRAALSTAPAQSPLRAVPALFLIGWLLLAASEVFAPMGGPSVPMALAVVAGLLWGAEIGGVAGASVGLAADLLSGLPIGSQALVACLIGLAVGSFSTTLSQSSWTGPALMALVISVPYRWLVGLVAEVGGHPGGARLEGFALVGWDVVLSVGLFLGLARWQQGRR